MRTLLLMFATVFTAVSALAQDLAKDQNSNYTVSRNKYMKTSDSINRWHSTTSQETYKAIDYMADKAEAREARKQFRRDIRMERARNGYYYGNNWGWPNYSPYYRYNRYYNGAYYNYWNHF